MVRREGRAQSETFQTEFVDHLTGRFIIYVVGVEWVGPKHENVNPAVRDSVVKILWWT